MMRPLLRAAVFAAATLAFAAPAAHAEDCEKEVLQSAVGLIQSVGAPNQVFSEQVAIMDANVAACPEHAWINVLGGEMDMIVFRTLRENNGGAANQEAVNFLLRALSRSNQYYEAPESERGTRYPFGIGYGTRLEFFYAENSRKNILAELIQIARIGSVHPYLKGEGVTACEGWVTGDALTIGAQILTKEDIFLFAFLDAAIAACRDGRSQFERLPLAVKATKILRLIERFELIGPAEIDEALIEANQLEKDFIREDEVRTSFFSEYESRLLAELSRRFGVHTGDGPETLDPSLWITPEHVGSDLAIRSVAFMMAGYWTPLAAGETDAKPEEVAKARNELGAWLIRLNRQGREAGLEEETRAMLKAAIAAFNSGNIRPPEAQDTKAMPEWFLNTLNDMLKRKPETPSETSPE